MRGVLPSIGLCVCLLLGAGPSWAADSKKKEGSASVSVDCQHYSGLIKLSILSHRKIGKVHIEVHDSTGRLIYVEEGKAMTAELVRQYDKAMLPKGAASVRVRARDLDITKDFTVQ